MARNMYFDQSHMSPIISLASVPDFGLQNLQVFTTQHTTTDTINNTNNYTDKTTNIYDTLDGKLIKGDKFVLTGNLNTGIQLMKLLQ